ncbi:MULTISPECIES: KTSC domain-containing protein [Rhizobium]|uniref:KTSC domain-containing protein n=2 Tax=Rhizobium/Agrobacterium group TaxID=227290 RepID=UPI0028972263
MRDYLQCREAGEAGWELMRIHLRSKLIDSVEYDEMSFRMTVFMSNGQVREFCEVPAVVIADLCDASSPGNYYMRAIRNRYPAP